jgi:hypothetical protein
MGKKGSSKYSTCFKIGNKFGNWTISGPVIMQGEAKVYVICNCGYTAAVSCYAIRKGTSKGCSLCDQKKRVGESNHTWRGFKDVPGSFIQRFTRKSKEKKWKCEIDAEVIHNLFHKQHQKCALTGLPIQFENLTKNKAGYSCTASIDRIDSNRGYTLDNIQLVHKDINIMKNAFEQEYFIEICKLIVSKSEVQ